MAGFFQLLPCVVACASLLICGCRVSDRPIGAPIQIKVPLGLPSLPVPQDNPPTADSIALGRRLFYDKQLSGDGSVACSSCHKPQLDFTDGASVATGMGKAAGVRNTPTIMNAAYLPFEFWDGRAISLEQQSASPIVNPLEMNQTHRASITKLASDPGYRDMFKKAFGSSDINITRVEKALASFERTVLSGNSPFDRYQYGGDRSSFSRSQIRGLAVFLDSSRGNCASCHTVGSHDALFTDGKFHNIGQGAAEAEQFNDVGRYHETKVATDMGAFKTPTLRNVSNTAPYMHDGSLKTLKEVVDFYAGGGNSNPFLDKEMRSIHLSARDRMDLVDFLQALTGEFPQDVGPPEGMVPLQ